MHMYSLHKCHTVKDCDFWGNGSDPFWGMKHCSWLALSSTSSLHCRHKQLPRRRRGHIRTHMQRNYSTQVVARVIWVTAPSAISSLLRGWRRERWRERNENNKRTDGIKKQWRWWRALAQATLPEDITVFSFFQEHMGSVATQTSFHRGYTLV